jgi:Thrombospondin type 3 repeat
MINNSILPYFRKDTSTLLAFSAIALLLLASSPLLFFNLLLLQPAQAQTTLSFKTPIPANGTGVAQGGALTFDAQGDTFRSSDQLYATGTYTITDISTGANSSGSILRVQGCCLSNPSNGDKISMDTAGSGVSYLISTSCSTSANNDISLINTEGGGEELDFSGPVECSSSSSQGGGGGNTTSSSMTGTTTQQDSDGDGIPDSSDNCPHNSHHRCFKEGDAIRTTTTHDQQPSSSSSSSSSSGNQTG